MNEMLLNILSVVVTAIIIPLITWGGTELIKFIQTKTKNVKAAEYLSVATTIVTNAVKSVFQTYVDSLKKEDAFTKKAQLEALTKAKETALSQISEEVKDYINKNYGNFDDWLTNQIESTINTLKSK